MTDNQRTVLEALRSEGGAVVPIDGQQWRLTYHKAEKADPASFNGTVKTLQDAGLYLAFHDRQDGDPWGLVRVSD